MPRKLLGIRPGAQEWAGNTVVLLTKASLKPRSVQDTQDETSRPCSVGHTDGDANDDTLFSGEMPGAVRASCVIRMEPHEVRAIQPTRGQTTAQTTQLISGGSGGDRGHLSPRVARSAWSALPNAREGEKLYGSFLNGAEGLRPRGELGQGAVSRGTHPPSGTTALEHLRQSQPGTRPCIAGVACGPWQRLRQDLGYCFCSYTGCGWT